MADDDNEPTLEDFDDDDLFDDEDEASLNDSIADAGDGGFDDPDDTADADPSGDLDSDEDFDLEDTDDTAATSAPIKSSGGQSSIMDMVKSYALPGILGVGVVLYGGSKVLETLAPGTPQTQARPSGASLLAGDPAPEAEKPPAEALPSIPELPDPLEGLFGERPADPEPEPAQAAEEDPYAMEPEPAHAAGEDPYAMEPDSMPADLVPAPSSPEPSMPEIQMPSAEMPTTEMPMEPVRRRGTDVPPTRQEVEEIFKALKNRWIDEEDNDVKQATAAPPTAPVANESDATAQRLGANERTVTTLNVKLQETESAIQKLDKVVESTNSTLDKINASVMSLQKELSKIDEQLSTLKENDETQLAMMNRTSRRLSDLERRSVAPPPAAQQAPRTTIRQAPAAQPASETAAAPTASEYRIEAVIPGRAWLRAPDGSTITVSEGDQLDRFGRVLAIDAYNGAVVLSSGITIRH